MASLSLQRTSIAPLLLLVASSHISDAKREIGFQYVEDSASCGTGEAFNIRMNSFHLDCGNANQGCAPGHNIMIYGEFEALDTFSSVAGIDIRVCIFGNLICAPSIVETDVNLCEDLALLDTDGYQACNQVGNYSFEAYYNIPNYTWWEDFVYEGFTFNTYIMFDDDLTCLAQFVTHWSSGNDAWMAVAGFALAAALVSYLFVEAYFLVQRKLVGTNSLLGEENKPERKTIIVKVRRNTPNDAMANPQQEIPGDDESATSTAYLRILDFPPEGLSRAERIEQVRQAHFERLRQTRNSRRGGNFVLKP